jgi:hypothetical protein
MDWHLFFGVLAFGGFAGGTIYALLTYWISGLGLSGIPTGDIVAAYIIGVVGLLGWIATRAGQQ